jgi:hypothetical protein
MKDKDLVVIAVHSPEFVHEEDVATLAGKMKEYQFSLPTYVDSGRHYFQTLSASGWPEVMLIDRQGQLRYSYLGETHEGFVQARAIDKSLAVLLAE